MITSEYIEEQYKQMNLKFNGPLTVETYGIVNALLMVGLLVQHGLVRIAEALEKQNAQS